MIRNVELSQTNQFPKGLCAQVSDEDYARVVGDGSKWHPVRAGKKVFARRTFTLHREGKELQGRSMYLHRFIVDAPKGARVIFKDGDTLNCTRENLVLVPKKKRKTVRKKLSRTARLRRLRRETGY